MSLRPLNTQERAAATAKAAQARAIRAEVKRQVKAGDTTIADVIQQATTDEALSRLRVAELLEAFPGIGEVRAAKLMEDLGIAPNRRLRGLEVHQQKALIAWNQTVVTKPSRKG